MRRGAPTRRPAVPAAMSGEGSARARRAEQEAMRAWVRMLTVHKRALAILREHLERDMTLPRFDLLAHLARGDGQTLAALAKRMLVTSGNLTGLVDRAARDGLVERRADPRDRRAWQVHLTAKGQRAFRDTERRHATRVSKLFDDFSREELSVLSHLLDKLKTGIRDKPPPTRARGAATLRGRATPAQTSERSKRRRP
jgi:DNA-binding MarR family transcriptional regulator